MSAPTPSPNADQNNQTDASKQQPQTGELGGNAPVVVTLVHGTFDTKARWTEPDSKLCRAITDQIGSNVLVTNFRWSGRNSQVDRREAAKNLVSHIAAHSANFPSSPHFVVGHSHGGNILRWALESMPHRALTNVAAAVTVSTPFVELRRRRFSGGISLLIFIWRVVVTFALGLGWLAFFAAHYEAIANFCAPFLVATQVGGVMLLAFVPLLVWFKIVKNYAQTFEAWLLTSLNQRQRQLLSENASLNVVHVPALCIYTRADEVNRIFYRARIVVELARLIDLLAVLKPPKEELRKLRENIRPFVAFLLFVGAFVVFGVFIGNMAGRGVSGSLLFDYGAPLAAFGLFLGLALPIAIAVGIWLCGTDEAMDLLVIDFHTSMKPAGFSNITVLKIAPNIAGLDGVSRNVHTGILYGDEAASKIAAFLKGTLASGGPRES